MSDATAAPSGSTARKFDPDGSPRRFPGNTVLCRIGSGNPAFATIASIQSALRKESFARKFAFVPAATFHMTIFDGAKCELRAAGAWPAGMADRTLADVNAHFAEKLRGIDVPSGFRMRPTGLVLDAECGSVIRLAPGDHGEVRRLRLLRERLAGLMEMPLPATQAAHITLSHLVVELDSGDEAAITTAHSALTVHLSRALSMVEFGWPEFCTHENVLSFERVLHLRADAK